MKLLLMSARQAFFATSHGPLSLPTLAKRVQAHVFIIYAHASVVLRIHTGSSFLYRFSYPSSPRNGIIGQ